MSRKTTGSGHDLEDALAAALAGALGVGPDDIRVRVSAPEGTRLTGTHLLELRIEDPSTVESDTGADQDVEEPASSDAPAPKGRQARVRAGAVESTSTATPPESDAPEEAADTPLTAEELDAEADAAADFLEGLLDALDLPGDLRIKVHADHAELEIVDIGSGALIGRRGQTLEAIQELVRCTLQRQFQRRSRIKIDAEGYRARRMEKLVEKTEEAIDEVLETGEAVRLEPMDVFERKAVHQMVAEVDGLTSRSQGREPARRVVVVRE